MTPNIVLSCVGLKMAVFGVLKFFLFICPFAITSIIYKSHIKTAYDYYKRQIKVWSVC